MALMARQFVGNPRVEQASIDRLKPLAKPEFSDGVKRLQQALRDLGFTMGKTFVKGAPDGVYGGETEAAVRQFQSKYGLRLDGMAGPDTIRKMDELLRGTEMESKHAYCYFPWNSRGSNRLNMDLAIAGTGPVALPLPSEIATKDVPEALIWIASAKMWLMWCLQSFWNPNMYPESQLKPYWDAVDTHFHVRSKPFGEQQAFLMKVTQNYAYIALLLANTGANFGDDMEYYPPDHPRRNLQGAWAHAPIGGFHNGKTEKKIWFRPRFREVSGQKCRIAMIIHECAHSAATAYHYANDWPKPDGAADAPKDVNVVHPRNYKQLLPDEAVENACSYPAFAANARFGDDIRPGAHNLAE